MSDSTETTRYTSEEISESLTGFEEIGITQAFGITMGQLKDNMPARALIFVVLKREGLNHDDAYKAVMNMPAKELADRFADDDEIVPDEPETESGKDDSQPVSEPTS